MKLYAEISKRDDEQRMVWGYASTESTDSQGEIIKSSAIESALADYMKFGNIRVMHQPIAVGVAKEAEMTEKGLFIGAKIVDDDAWNKVKEGVYKGFSIGGSCTGRDTVNKKIITGVRLSEISLVDRPANPDAVFEIWKGDGMNMDMTKEQAVEALAEMLNKGEIDPAELLDVAKACKAKKVEKEDDEMEELKEDPAHEAKESAEEERAEHGADGEAKENPEEELDEEVKEDPAHEANESADEEEAEEEAKLKAKTKKSDESTDIEKADFSDEISKAVGIASEKHAEEIKKFEGVVSSLQETLEKIEKRMKELEDLPAPAKGALMSVSKASDSGSDPEKDESNGDAASEIRKIHKSGGILFK